LCKLLENRKRKRIFLFKNKAIISKWFFPEEGSFLAIPLRWQVNGVKPTLFTTHQ